MGSLANGLKTCGKPFCARTEEKSVNQVAACVGITRETPSSTLELRTSLPSVGRDGPGECGADQPGDQQHRHDVDQRAAGRVQGARRATR